MSSVYYQALLYFQCIALVVDIMCNGIAELFRNSESSYDVWSFYIVQLVCIFVNILALFMSFLNTYVFKSGHFHLLTSRFKSTIWISIFYLGITAGLYTWRIIETKDNAHAYVYSAGLGTLFCAQRIAAIFYYHFYKKTILQLGHPKFYRDSEWIRNGEIITTTT
eukprot:Nk52_evm16s281 gene=Nk52_evmTU16s281